MALKDQLADAVVFDGRNLYEPHTLETFGLTYFAIGRGTLPGAKSQLHRRRKSDKAV